MNHFNALTPAEHERLALLSEECGELVQAIGKILRHGYESYNPEDGWAGLSNRRALERECGDVRHAMIRMCEARDLREEAIHEFADRKALRVAEYLHHQQSPEEG